METTISVLEIISANLDKSMAETKKLWDEYDRDQEALSQQKIIDSLKLENQRLKDAIIGYWVESGGEVDMNNPDEHVDIFLSDYL